MAYTSVSLDEVIQVESIVTIHYFEYSSDFHFAGESHDFWEFQCVDKGEVEVVAGENLHVLKRGQIIFHKPDEFHNLNANGKSAPNIVVIAFQCHSPMMEFFENRILEINDQERQLMALIIAEARRCFSSPLDDPYLEQMKKRKDSPWGSQQLIKLYLEQMLIYMIQRHTVSMPSCTASRSSAMKEKNPLYDSVIRYLENHIQEYVTIEDICHSTLMGRSQLQKLFRERHHCGVIEFFSRMKIDFAKELIRKNQMNFTQISEYLGYSSIHYFSRQFKKISGMTPSEYSSSIKALSEGRHSS